MMAATQEEMEAWDKGVQAQSLTNAGFCGYCGEACRPFHFLCPQELRDTACEYNGNHPRCDGDHKMELEGKTGKNFGEYEIYACTNPHCDYRESY
ncbi:hypothetical protein UFOVP253_16 [uncultured Caudovirales phage]|uniref:Uncharacterized protein n=1 Tax=uncultured Caudovirales phage TaxID=2100421 RepID=A0A6J5LGK1_9CAUD|nr:hypothetical protein UFOVP253_16 [uncultured Caudovirales phage]